MSGDPGGLIHRQAVLVRATVMVPESRLSSSGYVIVRRGLPALPHMGRAERSSDFHIDIAASNRIATVDESEAAKKRGGRIRGDWTA